MNKIGIRFIHMPVAVHILSLIYLSRPQARVFRIQQQALVNEACVLDNWQDWLFLEEVPNEHKYSVGKARAIE